MSNRPAPYLMSQTPFGAVAGRPDTRIVQTPAAAHADGNNARIAAALQELKAARARLESPTQVQVAAAERQIALIIGYLASLFEAANIPIPSLARGTAVPAIALLTRPASLTEAVDDLIRSLEQNQVQTRMPLLAAFIAGGVVGYALGKAIDYAFS